MNILFQKMQSYHFHMFCCIRPEYKYLMHINYSVLKCPALAKASSISSFHIKPFTALNGQVSIS